MGDDQQDAGRSEGDASTWREPRREPGARSRQPSLQTAHLAIAARLSQAIAGERSLLTALRECVASCLGHAGIVGGALYLPERASGELRLECQQGFALAALERADPGLRLVGEACRRRETLQVPSSEVQLAQGERLCHELVIDSALVLPLVWAREAEGVLLLGAYGHALLDGEAVAFARLAATQLAQALAHERALARLASRRATAPCSITRTTRSA